jgi:hypothetical protein
MKNLKVGDVVEENRVKQRVLAVTGELVALSFNTTMRRGGYGLCEWLTLDELKDYTLVQPEKTLEEKFEEYRDVALNNGTRFREAVKDLAQIAEEHYKDKR